MNLSEKKNLPVAFFLRTFPPVPARLSPTSIFSHSKNTQIATGYESESLLQLTFYTKSACENVWITTSPLFHLPQFLISWRFLWRLILKDCLHGGGGPKIGQVTCGGHPTYISYKRDQIKMRDYMDRWVTLRPFPIVLCNFWATFGVWSNFLRF